MTHDLPRIIQGGMGVGVSGWRLANAVGSRGHLGVVSGVALDVVHARRLGDGDRGGHLRRAYAEFPNQEIVADVLDRYYLPDGRQPDEPYRTVPKLNADPPAHLIGLTVLANFAEIRLAKSGHTGPAGVNYLTKVQLPTPYAILGAVLGGADFIIMGAGIPIDIPPMIRGLAAGEPIRQRLDVIDAKSDVFVDFDPRSVVADGWPRSRPKFLAIISSNTLAVFLSRNPNNRPDGFVVERPIAGGHNAPPRGKGRFDELGQPEYGPRDEVDLAKLQEVGLPFWLAGGSGRPGLLRQALDSGAVGVQVGTAFAFCQESDIESSLKQDVIDKALADSATVFTDPLASPSGYPFKVVDMSGTISEEAVAEDRTRVCDLGFLRSTYQSPDGTLGYRCAAEPRKAYIRKGGEADETDGRRCLCNGLFATVDLPQVRKGGLEPPLVTSGDDINTVIRALCADSGSYSAADVIEYLEA